MGQNASQGPNLTDSAPTGVLSILLEHRFIQIGAAELGVKILKIFFKKNKTTSTSSAKLLLGHNTRTPFYALIPDTKEVLSANQTAQIKRHGKRQHNIGTGDSVAVSDYRDIDRKWAMGTVKNNTGKKRF